MTPVRAWFGPKGFAERADASVAALRDEPVEDEHAVLAHLDQVDQARREAVSPVERIQHALEQLGRHPLARESSVAWMVRQKDRRQRDDCMAERLKRWHCGRQADRSAGGMAPIWFGL
jgi:hypothetical protein